tara:strand:- start:225 stop:392 length:168 start_codon:yes stop_codon:yes gene_type:complete
MPTTQQLGFAIDAATAAVVANAVGFDAELSSAAYRVMFWVFAALHPPGGFACAAA